MYIYDYIHTYTYMTASFVCCGVLSGELIHYDVFWRGKMQAICLFDTPRLPSCMCHATHPDVLRDSSIYV